ncbi:MAG: hypothetical protein U9N84_01115, partial [Actinomycetota bacterium]|nr:hypothetical protein [Actinomycetota bacterium]
MKRANTFGLYPDDDSAVVALVDPDRSLSTLFADVLQMAVDSGVELVWADSAQLAGTWSVMRWGSAQGLVEQIRSGDSDVKTVYGLGGALSHRTDPRCILDMREESGGVVATWSAAGTPLDSTDEAIQEERWTQVVSGLRRAADVVDPLYGAITFLFGLPAGRDELADPSFNDGITTWFLSNRLS